jgi:alkanesulfonate monooxygenase
VTVDVYWTLPVAGWGSPAPTADRGITDLRPGRFTDLDRTLQVARAAEATGATGVLVPYDPAGDDAFITATALAREVPRLRFMVEIQPGFATAVYTAKLALSFQRFFDDRLVWKLALDTPAAVQRAVGDHAEGVDRVARAAELLDVSAGVWGGAPYSHSGDWFTVTAGGFFGGAQEVAPGHGVARRPAPPVVLDGAGDAEVELSAQAADLHLFDLQEPDVLAGVIDGHRRRAAGNGRVVRYGLRFPVLAREHAAEAWRDLDRAWTRAAVAGPRPEPQPGIGGRARRWRGFARLGLGRDAGLVGSFDEVAASLDDLAALGVSTLVLEGLAPLDDVYRSGEFVLPLLGRPAPDPDRSERGEAAPTAGAVPGGGS